MNKLKTATLLFCLTLVSVSALGQIKVVDHATHKADDTTTAAVPTTANGNVDSITPMMEKMQDGMKQMQDVMAQIQGSRDPVERRALLDKHQQAMQAQMQVMLLYPRYRLPECFAKD